MKKHPALVALSALWLVPLPAAAQAVHPAPASKEAVAHVRGTVEFLADDLLEGRDTGSRGHEIAATYVASQFRAMGLTPAGENGGWFQWVPFRTTTAKPGSTRVSLSGKPFTADEAVVQPSVVDKVQDVDAPLLFVGAGIDDRQLGLHDYAGLDARGKVVVVLRGTPPGLASDIAAHLDSTKLETAARMGAVGAIFVGAKAPPAGAKPRPARAFPSTEWVDVFGKTSSGAASKVQVISLSESAAQRLFNGARRSLEAVRGDVARKVMPKGFALPGRIVAHSESEWQDFRSPEVAAILPGSDPVLKNEYVAVMGHLDHLGMGKASKPGEDVIANGALDNAAGVATVLEAARQFAEAAQKPKRSMLFVIHTGEEKGLLGASYYADHPTVPIKSIVGGVDLDMPLVLYPFTDVVAFGGNHSTIEPAIVEAGKSMGISVSPDFMPEEGIFVRSDHYEFVRRGIPAVLLATGTANGGKAKWDQFFGGFYHRPSDDLKQAIDWDALARYAELNHKIAATMANSPQRTMWYEGNYFGNLFNPGGPRAKAAR